MSRPFIALIIEPSRVDLRLTCIPINMPEFITFWKLIRNNSDLKVTPHFCVKHKHIIFHPYSSRNDTISAFEIGSRQNVRNDVANEYQLPVNKRFLEISSGDVTPQRSMR